MQTQEALLKKESPGPTSVGFVEAGKLFEQLEQLTRSLATRAHAFFEARGRQIGSELEDWFRAESELMRPVPIEMTEDKDQLSIKAEVPGFKASDIKIGVEPQRLIFEGTSKETIDEKSEKVVFNERRSNYFCRSLDLPVEVDASRVSAILKDGVLEIKMPKSPRRESTAIEVKSA